MTDDTNNAETATDAQGNEASKNQGPPFLIRAEYVKDLSVENPKVPEIFSSQNVGEIRPKLDIRTSAKALGNRIAEVTVTTTVTGLLNADKPEEDKAYVIELAYGVVIAIGDVPENLVEPLLMVEAPRTAFPFIREIVADATLKMGFRAVRLPALDFMGVYAMQKKEGAVDEAVAKQIIGEKLPSAAQKDATSTETIN